MVDPKFVLLEKYRRYPEQEMLERARSFHEEIRRRRTVRDFSDEPIPTGLIEECIAAAATAPSGANMQPWHFVVIRDPAIKRRIREAALPAPMARITVAEPVTISPPAQTPLREVRPLSSTLILPPSRSTPPTGTRVWPIALST